MSFPGSHEGPALIGVVHLAPLPGSPGWGGAMEEVIERALTDARAYEEGGCDALIAENFGDAPFTRGAVGPETVAAMAVAGRWLRREISLPLGFNVLRNDAAAALGLCAACDGSFLRVNVHTGAMITDQGLIEGNAYETLRLRERICPGVKIFADVMVKHAAPVAATDIETAAEETCGRGGADGLIISGKATGAEIEIDDLWRTREACPEAYLLVGSGVTESNAGELLEHADALIVGTSLKVDGVLANPVDVERVRSLKAAMA